MVVMATQKKPIKLNQLRTLVSKEMEFMKNVFSKISLPQRNMDEDGNEYVYTGSNGEAKSNAELPKRAQNIGELEERLEKLKSKNNFNLKNKLMKKSLASKINKKLKKKERKNKNKVNLTGESRPPKKPKSEKANIQTAKPVFNNEGKLVFSKFDFANTGQRVKPNKTEKDPKKILDNLKTQEEKLQKIAQEDGDDKAQEIRQKMSWKNVLQKAEGTKVKDDQTLLKKSIKRMEQKKKQSKKQWTTRLQNVEQKKADRQKKRQENISKKKKEKKSKVVKASAKRGRVVI